MKNPTITLKCKDGIVYEWGLWELFTLMIYEQKIMVPETLDDCTLLVNGEQVEYPETMKD